MATCVSCSRSTESGSEVFHLLVVSSSEGHKEVSF